jgi:hypothetical protein
MVYHAVFTAYAMSRMRSIMCQFIQCDEASLRCDRESFNSVYYSPHTLKSDVANALTQTRNSKRDECVCHACRWIYLRAGALWSLKTDHHCVMMLFRAMGDSTRA